MTIKMNFDNNGYKRIGAKPKKKKEVIVTLLTLNKGYQYP